MATFVKASDILSIAVEIERRGNDFYRTLADRAESDTHKAFFIQMASEEKVHESIFSAMLQRVGGTDIPQGATGEEYMHYVSDIIDSHCLFSADQAALATASPIAQAMQLEKDTLLYFLAMESMVPESEQHHVRACAEEERKHLHRLSVLRNQTK